MDDHRYTVYLLCLHVCLLLYGLCGAGDQCLAAISACGVSVCGSGAVLGEGFAKDNATRAQTHHGPTVSLAQPKKQ